MLMSIPLPPAGGCCPTYLVTAPGLENCRRGNRETLELLLLALEGPAAALPLADEVELLTPEASSPLRDLDSMKAAAAFA